MPSSKRIALVTGGNRGIGFEICRKLAGQGITVLLGARALAKANEAAKKLQAEGLDVQGRQLDVTSDTSAKGLATSIGKEFGRLDILVNNAGISLDHDRTGLTTELKLVEQTLETNLVGPWRCTLAFAELLKKSGHGRVVNVSSQLGQLQSMEDGYPGYRVSKAGLNALSRILAASFKGTGVLVNSACPGWVRTDMGGPNAPGTAEQGADTPFWLATLPDDGPTGGFFQNRKAMAW